MKNKFLLVSTLFVGVLALSSCCNQTTQPPRTKYQNKFIYQCFDGTPFTNETTYTYENNDKLTSREIKRVLEGTTEVDVPLFKNSYVYDDNYNLVTATSESFTMGSHSTVIETYTYNNKGLMETYHSVESIDGGEFYQCEHIEYEYNSSNQLTSIKSYDSSEVLNEKYEYSYDLNETIESYYDLTEDLINPKTVYVTSVSFDDQLKQKVITEKYTVVDFESCDYTDIISYYNSKGLITRCEEYNKVITYEYNGWNNITKETHANRDDWESPISLSYEKTLTYDSNGFIVKQENYDYNEEVREETPYLTYLYEVDSDGYVIGESEYEGASLTPISISTYVLSQFRTMVNKNLDYEEGYNKTNYNGLLS